MNTVLNSVVKVFWRKDVLVCMLCGLVFYGFPSIDMWVTSQFYENGQFFLRHHPIVQAIYLGFAKMHLVFLGVFLSGLGLFCGFKNPSAKLWRKRLRFLILVLLIAPGLLVNVTLKDNSFGRPRPVHLEEFGGTSQFTPVLTYSGQCQKNCSFVSGHAALGFYLIAFGWLFARRDLFLLGVAVGIAVGSVRIMQGGHFLSDVVFSFWVVYFTTLLIAWLYRFTFVHQKQVCVRNFIPF